MTEQSSWIGKIQERATRDRVSMKEARKRIYAERRAARKAKNSK